MERPLRGLRRLMTHILLVYGRGRGSLHSSVDKALDTYDSVRPGQLTPENRAVIKKQVSALWYGELPYEAWIQVVET